MARIEASEQLVGRATIHRDFKLFERASIGIREAGEVQGGLAFALVLVLFPQGGGEILVVAEDADFVAQGFDFAHWCPCRGSAGRKKPAAPSSRSFLQDRLTVTSGTPKAREISPCEALPLEMSWLVKKRNEAKRCHPRDD